MILRYNDYMKKKRQKKKLSQTTLIMIGIISTACIISLLLFIIRPQPSYMIYRVESGQNKEKIETVTSLKKAMMIMKNNADASQEINTIIENEKGQRIAIAYGIVNFNTKGNCGLNTEYQLESENIQGYTNGCYGADGLYLDTIYDKEDVLIRFQQASAIGLVPINDVELLNIFDQSEVASVNTYTVEEGEMKHQITTDVTTSSHAVSLSFGKAPDGLEDGTYYSYNGHDFYDTLINLIDDKYKNTNENRFNNKAYYFSYQFMTQDSKSSYSEEEIDWYITNYLGFVKIPTLFPTEWNASMLVESGSAFINAQNTYQVNAIGMFGLACNESDFGRSELAYDKRNLFGHAAYDASPTQSAAVYDTIGACIDVHAQTYMRGGYFNDQDSRYHGAYWGDKAGGMNVRYASDPYWGEKAAINYMQFDAILGYKDQDIPLADDIQ